MIRIRCLAGLVLLLGIVGIARAQENWQVVYQDDSMRVAVDMASIVRDGQIATFRERHVLTQAEVDGESLRRIVEIQYRRSADCQNNRLAVLSSAMFSNKDAMVRYEASKRDSLNWSATGSGLETSLYEVVCGVGR